MNRGIYSIDKPRGFALSTPVSILVRQLVSFAGCGIIGASAHYTTLLVAVEVLHLNPLLASSIGFAIGALVNYYFNRTYTFRSSVPHIHGLPKFATVAVIGMFFNTSIMSLAISHLSVHYIIAQICATGCVFLWNFSGHRFWTFAHTEKHKNNTKWLSK